MNVPGLKLPQSKNLPSMNDKLGKSAQYHKKIKIFLDCIIAFCFYDQTLAKNSNMNE